MTQQLVSNLLCGVISSQIVPRAAEGYCVQTPTVGTLVACVWLKSAAPLYMLKNVH